MTLKTLCRLVLTTELSNRMIGQHCKASHNTVLRYRDRLREEQLSWTQVSAMSDTDLAARLNVGRDRRKKKFAQPDWSHVHSELHRPGVTISLLYEEYALGAAGLQMSDREFRRRYDAYKRRLGVVMRQVRRPGEELFVDYSGKRPSITDPKTGEQTPVEMWVGVLGSGRKTFAYCTLSQQLPDWIDAHVRALEFFGAEPKYLVPDNLKSAVVKIIRGQGHQINPTYQAFADHYDIMVMPARPRKPKDKAVVENAVRLAQMWILARLRNRVFFSIHELNRAIAELLEQLNNKPMRTRGNRSRNELFEQIDRPAMQALRQHPYEYADWKIGVAVPQDYHVLWEGNYYSVPYGLITRRINLRATVSTVEAYHGHQVVATHQRSYGIGEVFTKKEHQPPAHRLYGEDGSAELVIWAETAGASVHSFMQRHLQVHPPAASIQALRGLKRLARDFGSDRLDQACERALRMNATSISSIRSMLVRGIELAPLQDDSAVNDPIAPHENVRGAANYE